MIKPVNASQIHNTYVPKLCGDCRQFARQDGPTRTGVCSKLGEEVGRCDFCRLPEEVRLHEIAKQMYIGFNVIRRKTREQEAGEVA